MKSLSLFLVFLISAAAHAEYRVFTLLITNEKTQVTRQVQTTLDPQQYIDFFPLGEAENITYVSTWKCLGRTPAFKSHCENPHLNTLTADSQVRSPAGDSSQSPEVP